MKLFAQKDAEEFIKTGAKEFRYDREIRITPGAKDVLTESGVKIVFNAGGDVLTLLSFRSVVGIILFAAWVRLGGRFGTEQAPGAGLPPVPLPQSAHRAPRKGGYDPPS